MNSSRTRLAGPVAAALLAVGALTGCGATGVHPGAAAQVGDVRISQSEVDDVSRDVCTALQSDPQLIGSGYARSTLRQTVVQAEVMRAIGTQMAQDYGVTTSSSYDSTVRQVELQLAGLDEDVRDNIMDTWTSNSYFVDILTAVGEQELHSGGVSSPTADEALAKGIELAQVWEVDNGIEIDPRYPTLTISDTGFVRGADATNVAVSDFATQAAAEQPDPAFVQALPASQQCAPQAG